MIAALSRIDAAWQRVESRLCAAVLVAEIVSLTLWVSLKGLSTDYLPGGNVSGLVYRGLLTAALAGLVARQATRACAEDKRRLWVTGALVAGLLSAGLWAHAAVGWSSNVLNWLQNASALMLIGGLRGLGTRLTLWLAMLGASLATSRGKHIHVDVFVRYLPSAFRAPASIVGCVGAAVVCLVGALGFVDYISIAEYRASAVQPCPGDPGRSCDTPPGDKLAAVGRAMRSDLFLLGRQVSLDARSVREVLAGRPYDRWMSASDWNAWLDGAPWASHFDESAVQALRMDPSETTARRMPQVAVPGTGEDARGLLIRELNFVFPFGLAVIAMKLLLRIVLLLGRPGDAGTEPDAADDPSRAQGAADDASKGAEAPA